MAWIGIRVGVSKFLATPSSVTSASKPFLQINLQRICPIQAASISGSALRDKSKVRPAPFPYKTKSYNMWRAWLQDTTTHRFDENTKIIVVEGPIAAGKTAFAKSLAEDLDMLHMPEVTMDNLYINSYGYDLRKLDPKLPPGTRSFDEKNFCLDPNHENVAKFQILKYKLRYSQYVDALAHLLNTGQGVVLERCVYSDFVFLETMFKSGYVIADVFVAARNVYYDIQSNTLGELMKPHLVIYLDVPVSTVQQRITARNIPHEVNSKVFTEQYLSDMEYFYKQRYLKEIGTAKRIHVVVSIEEKCIIEWFWKRETVVHLTSEYEIGVTTVRDLIKNKDKMTERIEQRYCIKFCQKLGDSQSQTIRKIQQVFGEDAMGVTQIKEWFNRFKDGRTSAESEQRCGRPQTARSAAVVERVRNLVMADRRLTVREIAKEVGDLLDTANTDPGFLNTVITGDESWVYGYDPETKRQSSQWKHPESPRPKKARQVRSKIKVMLTVFFDVRGIVNHEYAPEGQMVTKEYYHDVLRRLRDAVRRKRPDMWTANNWHLHHDNAPAHSSQLIHTFLAKHGITTFRQPPYSPDLAPCDFWLFPKLKTPLKGSRFESREEIMRNATTELNTIPKEDFQRCFRQWKDRWAKTHAELLIYDWSSHGDVEVVVEDIERIDFDNFDKYDPKMKDWRLESEWDWNTARIQYTSDKANLMNLFLVPRFDVPELVVDGHDGHAFKQLWLNSKNLKVRIYKTVILPVVLYGCETWTLTLREEHTLKVFENKVLRKIFGAKRDEVTGERRKLHNTELHTLYSSPDIIRNIKSRCLRWAGHVARMGESTNAYRVLVGRPEGKRPLGRPRYRWEDNIKMDLKEMGYDDREWINFAQDRDQWQAYVRAAMNLRVP
ncbi:hypothetical protein ANN_27315 [Periplaneta americana]|uniref:NADH dehydrogenase [ubiquinone] 1 alpha subcomplex subunit 10, mitochondrial n=1 Tax=Periplaneta americana TaxID=6978 RepID=A0ABQ8RXQ1_PERAM|nr:hypothetical protein ANN_27315 [Periplaneta americana]